MPCTARTRSLRLSSERTHKYTDAPDACVISIEEFVGDVGSELLAGESGQWCRLAVYAFVPVGR